MAGNTLNIALRPDNFEDVIGLAEPIATVKNFVTEQRIPRAFILEGPFGCGKTTLAYIIAKAVQGWAFDGSPQIQFVNAASVTGIDSMRKLVDGSRSFPMVGNKGVIILDEAHKLSKPAQESLLTEFESPDSPTVWIICTTDPQKLMPGLKAGRCVTLQVRFMVESEIRELVKRAAAEIKFTGDTGPFISAVLQAKIGSPRKVLMAFETFAMGTNVTDAVASQAVVTLPEYHDIAFAVCYGKWASSVSLWGGKVNVRPVGELLKELDEAAKKKKATADTEESDESTGVEPDDLIDKNEMATGLRAVVGAFLKGMVLPKIQKGGGYKQPQPASAFAAAEAMVALSQAPGYELAWSGLFTTLFRVNQIIQKASKQ